MNLSPKRVFMDMKKELWAKGIKNPHREKDLSPHNLREERKNSCENSDFQAGSI